MVWAPVGTAPTIDPTGGPSTSSTWPQIFYKNLTSPGDANFIGTSTCVYWGVGFHRCSIPAYASTTSRTLQYYIEVRDTDDLVRIGTSTAPYQISVQNTPLGPGSISGYAIFGPNVDIATTVNHLATTTIQLDMPIDSYNEGPDAPLHVNDYVIIDAHYPVIGALPRNPLRNL